MMCECGLYSQAQMKAFRRCCLPRHSQETFNTGRKAGCRRASDFFAVHSRRLAGLLRLTIYSEPFSFARKVVGKFKPRSTKFLKTPFLRNVGSHLWEFFV
jgi:hypothetical protein